MIAHETLINIEHPLGLGTRLRFSFVNGVTFLPKKFARPQKEARPHFPADNVCPLVDQNGKVAIRLYPLCIARSDNRFRCWPNHQRLGQGARWPQLSVRIGLESTVGNDGAFLCEAFDVLSFLREITQWNEKWEVGIAVSGRTKHGVELPLHIFPDTVSPGADHHAAAYIRGLGQLRSADNLLVPFRKIVGPPRRNCGLRHWNVR